MRKALFELYLITGISLLMGFGWDEDSDDDSYFLYMLARTRRELLSFISPETAWDVLRSPTVAMNTIGGMRKIIYDVGDAGFALATGNDLPVYQSGHNKDRLKLVADVTNQLGLRWIDQFESLGVRTRFIRSGGW